MANLPGNARFAFTVFDDTDGSTVENVEPVYRFLAEIGLRTTKSVWPLASQPSAKIGGSTLAERDYLAFVRRLQQNGFEIGLHNVRNDDALRAMVIDGFNRFEDSLQTTPRTHCNHDRNRENLYWGPNRLETLPVRFAYNLSTRFKYHRSFEGHVEDSPYFWGDICHDRITYVRNFVFDEINLLRLNPTLPYHDPKRPFVNFWFSSTEGATVNKFCELLSEPNQDRLAEEGGVCIMYTHFSAGFFQNRELNPIFKRLMLRIAKMNGWFVPVATLLDYLRQKQETSVISSAELSRMEKRWLLSKLIKGTT